MQAFVDRFRAKATKARQAQSRLKLLAKLEPITARVANEVREFEFAGPEKALSPPIVAMTTSQSTAKAIPCFGGWRFIISTTVRQPARTARRRPVTHRRGLRRCAASARAERLKVAISRSISSTSSTRLPAPFACAG
jgi:hypothetical protein